MTNKMPIFRIPDSKQTAVNSFTQKRIKNIVNYFRVFLLMFSSFRLLRDAL